MTQEAFSVAGDEYSPSFRFDPQKRSFLLKGRSRMEEAVVFYGNVGGMLIEAVEEGSRDGIEYVLRFELIAVKTASAAAIRDMLAKIAAGLPDGVTLAVVWCEMPGAANRNAATLIEQTCPSSISFCRTDPSPRPGSR
ncbi:DUF1987 domain-containing protein [Salipiger pentaromativorans]|uniref:DUF1987 domain-containing protein n=1 Tax=Salipiger pentaromativorans TaxID=2943193 RepID=UPI00215765D6